VVVDDARVRPFVPVPPIDVLDAVVEGASRPPILLRVVVLVGLADEVCEVAFCEDALDEGLEVSCLVGDLDGVRRVCVRGAGRGAGVGLALT
jgi:hypothetical protein